MQAIKDEKNLDDQMKAENYLKPHSVKVTKLMASEALMKTEVDKYNHSNEYHSSRFGLESVINIAIKNDDTIDNGYFCDNQSFSPYETSTSNNYSSIIFDEPSNFADSKRFVTKSPKRKHLFGKKDTKSQCTPINIADALSFEIVNGATQRGRPMLIDNYGYTYNIKKIKMDEIIWRCSVRNKYVECTSIILQDKKQVYSDQMLSDNLNNLPTIIPNAVNNFSIVDHYLASYPWLFTVDPRDIWYKGPSRHIHPQPKKSSLEKIKLTAQVKQMAQKDISQSPALILSRIAVPPNVSCQPPTVYQMLATSDLTTENNFDASNINYSLLVPSDLSSNQDFAITALAPGYTCPNPSVAINDQTHGNYAYDNNQNITPQGDASLLQSTILTSPIDNINLIPNYRRDLLRAINRTRNNIISRDILSSIIDQANMETLPQTRNAQNLNQASSTLQNHENLVPPPIKNCAQTSSQNVMAAFQNSPFFDDSDNLGYYSQPTTKHST